MSLTASKTSTNDLEGHGSISRHAETGSLTCHSGAQGPSKLVAASEKGLRLAQHPKQKGAGCAAERHKRWRAQIEFLAASLDLLGGYSQHGLSLYAKRLQTSKYAPVLR